MDREIVAYSIVNDEERQAFLDGEIGTYEILELDLSLIEDFSVFQDGNAFVFVQCLIPNIDLVFSDVVAFEYCDFKGSVEITSLPPDGSIDFISCNTNDSLESLKVNTPTLSFKRSKIETNTELTLKAQEMFVEPSYDDNSPNAESTSNILSSKGKITIDTPDLSMKEVLVVAPNIRFGKHNMLDIRDSKIIGRTTIATKEEDPENNFDFVQNLNNTYISILSNNYYQEEQDDMKKSL